MNSKYDLKYGINDEKLKKLGPIFHSFLSNTAIQLEIPPPQLGLILWDILTLTINEDKKGSPSEEELFERMKVLISAKHAYHEEV